MLLTLLRIWAVQRDMNVHSYFGQITQTNKNKKGKEAATHRLRAYAILSFMADNHDPAVSDDFTRLLEIRTRRPPLILQQLSLATKLLPRHTMKQFGQRSRLRRAALRRLRRRRASPHWRTQPGRRRLLQCPTSTTIKRCGQR